MRFPLGPSVTRQACGRWGEVGELGELEGCGERGGGIWVCVWGVGVHGGKVGRESVG